MPIISAVGKRRPQSTTDPPVVLDDGHGLADLADASQREDTTCRSTGGDLGQQSVLGERVVHGLAFLLVARDQRQAQRACGLPEHLEGRA